MPRILFIKTSSLGDVIHHCPAVSDAARMLPGAEIDWVVEEGFAPIAAMHRAVHRVFPVAVRRWRAAPWRPAVWAEVAAFRRAVAAARYDFVIDSQGLLKSALLALAARGVRHGYDASSAREPLANHFYKVRHPVSRDLHAVVRNRALTGAALGYAVQGPAEYGLGAGDEAPLDAGGRFCVLLTMTSRADKLWPEAYWSELAQTLAARGIASILPWGTDAERERCARIARGVPKAVVPRRMSLEELARQMRHAGACIGVDTGLTHLAAALGVPALGIFCGSDPALTGLHGGERVRNLGASGAPPSVAEVGRALEAFG